MPFNTTCTVPLKQWPKLPFFTVACGLGNDHTFSLDTGLRYRLHANENEPHPQPQPSFQPEPHVRAQPQALAEARVAPQHAPPLRAPAWLRQIPFGLIFKLNVLLLLSFVLRSFSLVLSSHNAIPTILCSWCSRWRGSSPSLGFFGGCGCPGWITTSSWRSR